MEAASLRAVPQGVLEDILLSMLDARTLCAVAMACRWLRDASETKAPWRQNCVALWRGKANMPFSYQGAAELPFGSVRLSAPGVAALSVRELKQLLLARQVDYSKLLEKAEFREAVVASTPPHVCGWTQRYDNIWKASFVYSLFDMRRTDITEQELTGMSWVMFLKPSRWSCDFSFSRGGTLSTTAPGVSPNSRWRFVGMGPRHVQVDFYPPLVPSRRASDWGWRLENSHAIFYSEHYAAPLSARALLEQEFGPRAS